MYGLKIFSNVVISNFIFLFGLFIFFYGFFPIDYNESKKASETDIPSTIQDIRFNSSHVYKRRISKVILMIVDAMRYDFILSDNLTFIKNAVNKNKNESNNINNDKNELNSYLLKLKVDVPTVTMPKIKTLMTGDISNFIDIVLNFGSTELKSDSIIYQIIKRKNKIVFYGDNTWIKLFPNSFHRYQANNDSFFVHDFYKGDRNITENVIKELKNDDWDLLILHYLGLDHIGHVEGAFSNKIQNKLSEIDNISNMIYLEMKNNLCKHLDLPCLFIITADHGMKNSGGHGGSSFEEIYVPLIIFPSKNIYMQKSDNYIYTKRIYKQNDFVPTISILFGIPIPSTNIGRVIPELINCMQHTDQLFAFHYNTDQLLNKAIDKFGEKHVKNQEYYDWYLSAIKFHMENLKLKQNNNSYISNMSSDSYKYFNISRDYYVKTSNKLSELISLSRIRFSITAVSIGIIISTLMTFILIIAVFCTPNILMNTSFFINIKDILISILITIFIGISIKINYNHYFSYDIFSLMFSSIYLNMLYVFLIIFLILKIGKIFRNYKNLKFNHYHKLSLWIILAEIFYAISLVGSSFIEEEHQLWYYFGTTALIYLTINFELKNQFMFDSIKDINKIIYNDDSTKCKRIFLLNLMILMFHTFVRRLNQTGDKWINVPDIGDWLVLNENKIFLNVLMVVALILTVIAFREINNEYITYFILYTVLFIIYLHKIFNGSFIFSETTNEYGKRILIKIFWINIIFIIVINLIRNCYNSKNIKNFINYNLLILILITLFLHKAHNMILVPVQILTIKMIFSTNSFLFKTSTSSLSNNLFCKIILCYWIGKMFFFYQGNSNGLATIDLNPGFIGLNSYNIFIVGILMTLNTYSAPLLSIIMLLNEIISNINLKCEENISQIFLLTSLLMIFPTTIYLYIMFIFRFHLFIWSVFSPKLLYESYQAVLYTAVYLIIYINYKLFKITNFINT